MNSIMTIKAYRNNSEPVFFTISFVMMVCCCLVSAITFLGTYTGHPTSSYFHSNCLTCSFVFWAILEIFGFCTFTFVCLSVFLAANFTLLAFIVAFLGSCPALSSLSRLKIGILALFTGTLQSIGSFSIFAELRSGFNFLATRASFCFNWLRHVLFLIKRVCLELVTAHTVAGLFYYTAYSGGVKGKC